GGWVYRGNLIFGVEGGFGQLKADTGEAALSPDGSRIVFEKDQELWQMEPNGENLVRLIQLPHGPQFAGHAGLSNWSNLAWSPDGRWLTYIRKGDESGAPVLEGPLLDAGRPGTILTDPALRGYSWLSDNTRTLNG